MELAITGFERPRVFPSEAATKERDNLLEVSCWVKEIKEEKSQNHAVDVAGELASFEKRVEQSRKHLKSPVLDLGKEIDSVAKELLEQVSQEKERISGLIAGYQDKVRKIALESKVAVSPIKPKGVVLAQEPIWEVTDILKLYEKHPELCRIEPNASEIRKKLLDEGCKSVPGLKIEWKTKASIRAKKPCELLAE